MPRPATAAIEAVAERLVSGVRTALGDDLVGVYVQGSFALGAGDEHSDLDFLVVTRRPLGRQQWDLVAALHSELPAGGLPYADRLEGSYAPLEDLRDSGHDHRPWPYVDNGSTTLVPSHHDDTVHLRWILRSCGIVLDGPPPEAVTGPVRPEDLRSEGRATLQTWQEALTADPELVQNAYRQFSHVLALCRVLYTVETAEIISKGSAARWAVDRLPADYAGLVTAALQDRDRWPSLLDVPSDPGRAARTMALQRWAVGSSARTDVTA